MLRAAKVAELVVWCGLIVRHIVVNIFRAAIISSFLLRAATSAELQAQAQALLAQVQALQAQLGAGITGGTGTGGTTIPVYTGTSGVKQLHGVNSSACPLIGRALGSASGDDVSRLQQFLARDPSVYPEARVTGYYGALTEAR